MHTVRMNSWKKQNKIEDGKKANSSQAVEMSCGSRQISAAAGVISAPRVGCIDEYIHNVVHP